MGYLNEARTVLPFRGCGGRKLFSIRCLCSSSSALKCNIRNFPIYSHRGRKEEHYRNTIIQVLLGIMNKAWCVLEYTCFRRRKTTTKTWILSIFNNLYNFLHGLGNWLKCLVFNIVKQCYRSFLKVLKQKGIYFPNQTLKTWKDEYETIDQNFSFRFPIFTS